MTTKIFLLAGCTSGIGLETLKLLLADGQNVIAAARNPQPLADFDGVECLEFDAEKSDPKLALPDRIDGLVYFHGTITLKPFRALRDQDFQHDLEVNFLGAVRLIRAALPALQKAENASIVLFSSVAV